MPADRTPYGEIVARAPVDAITVTVRGTPTTVWRYGAVEPRSTIVFLHGFRGDHHGLEPIVAHLVDADAGLRVLVPDLPGFGATPPLPSERHDVDGYARWTRELMAAFDGDVVLAGHSFGSIVAAATAAEDATGIAALVLVNPIASRALEGPRAASRWITAAFHRLAGALPEPVGEALLRHPLVGRISGLALMTTRDRDLRRWIHAEHGRYFAGFANRAVLLEAFEASVGHDVAQYAPAVKVPVLLIAGERDDLAPADAQRALLPLFPDARLVLLPGTGHLAHYEQPAEIAAALAEVVP
ncbi:Pimeloyl-ACP methyl ester carboxylesterase [Pseudonocardia thermophila]|uniref:Pimeloyl-ACP methyl ester carboxylesterase n=1 Tax=Pseudonocardia thermophila TaxID=1848 RepID=A0A1M6VU34_PSETH|nr:alpha/beta hydrolase [Pseudonocardia thermophila]SHK85062.1 Pimeloyl-ACP methyl ester carboxylesterase [Pseudonocardia thermophila]